MRVVTWELEVGSELPRFCILLKVSLTNLLLSARDPKDNTSLKDKLEYYIWLAKLAEKGKITSIFFADTYAGIHHHL